MKPRVKIAPSILSADYARLGEQVMEVSRAGADLIHVDVMDGRFVPQITIGPAAVRAIRKCTRLPLDVHLMIEDPQNHIDSFKEAGADILSVHAEACVHLHRTLEKIRACGLTPAVALNPATPLWQIQEIIAMVDMVLLMTVNPGYAGQSFIQSSLQKIAELRNIINGAGLRAQIEVDGGIGPANIGEAAAAGALVFVAGTAVFGRKAGNEKVYRSRVARLRRLALWGSERSCLKEGC